MRHRGGDEGFGTAGAGASQQSGGSWRGGGAHRADGGRGRRGARPGRRPYAREEAQEHLPGADPRVVAGPGPQAPQTPRQRRWGQEEHDDAGVAAGPYPLGPAGPPDDPDLDHADSGHADADQAGRVHADSTHADLEYDDLIYDEEAPRRRRGGGLLVAFLAILAAGLATALTLGFLELRALRQNEAAGNAALAAARTYVSDMLSYDHRHIEQDLARARGHATERLAGHYRKLAETLIPQVRREQTIQQVTVAGASVESATAERVRVLMLINLTTSRLPPGAKSRKGEVSQGRVRLVMVKGGDGAWLVDDLSTLLGNPPTRT